MLVETIETAEERLDTSEVVAIRAAQIMWDSRAVCARCSPDGWQEGQSVSDQMISCTDLVSDTRLRIDKEERTMEMIPGAVGKCPLKQALERQAINTLLDGMQGLIA